MHLNLPSAAATIHHVTAARPVPAHRKAWVLACAILGSSLIYVDSGAVNVALPSIEHALGAGASTIQWVINAYTLPLAALLLVGGGAGDRFGRRSVFMTGVLVFALGSIGASLAPGVGALIVARAVQGLGAALFIPCALAIIGATFEPAERGTAIGTWAGCSALAAAVGPIVGGLIVDHATWRFVFLMTPVLAVVALWIATRHLEESRDPDATGALDWPGAICAFAALGSLAFGLIEIPTLGLASVGVIASVSAGVALLVVFFLREVRIANPMLPLVLFHSRVFSGVNLVTMFLYAALAAAIFFLPFLMIQVHGFSSLLTGLVFLPFTVVMVLFARLSGKLFDRVGARLPLIIGPAVAGLGFGLIALLGGDAPYFAFIIGAAILGLGMVISIPSLTATVINAVPAHRVGVASGINNASAQLANLLAIAIFGAIALHDIDVALDGRMAAATSAQVRAAIVEAHGKFIVAPPPATLTPDLRREAETAVRDSLAEGIRRAVWLTALLAFAASATAALTIPGRPKKPSASSSASAPPA